MKLTITKLTEYKAPSGMPMVSVELESEPIETIDKVTNWFDISTRKIAKAIKADAFSHFFKDATVGSVINGWGIYTKHTFVPDQSEAAEAGKGVAKVQNFSFSKTTKKMYVTTIDGKSYPFFSKRALWKDGDPNAFDITFDNITAIPVLPGMLEGRRPNVKELEAAGLTVHPDTLKKLNADYNAPTVPTVTPPATAEANVESESAVTERAIAALNAGLEVTA